MVQPILDRGDVREVWIPVAATPDLLPAETLKHALHAIIVDGSSTLEIVTDHDWHICFLSG